MRAHLLLALVLGPLLLTSCLKPKPSVSVQTDTGAAIGIQVLERAMPKKGNVQDSLHGKETWFAYGPVLGTDGTNANGVATAHFLSDGTYILSVQLNINNAPEGQFYEGWLYRDSLKDAVSAGHLIQSLKRSQQSLRFESQEDLREALHIAITREKDDGDPTPGTLVAEGVLKVTRR